MFCSQCGNSVAGVQFCSKCGTPVASAPAAPSAPTTAPTAPYAPITPVGQAAYPNSQFKPTNGLAIASLITGVLCMGILAVIFGVIAKKQIRESNGAQSGDGMATAGLVLGIIGIVASAWWVFALIAATASTSYYY